MRPCSVIVRLNVKAPSPLTVLSLFTQSSAKELLYARILFQNFRRKEVLSAKRFYSIARGSGGFARAAPPLLLHSVKRGDFLRTL